MRTSAFMVRTSLLATLVTTLAAGHATLSGDTAFQQPSEPHGRSATLLPDGSWLLIGGEGVESLVSLWDPTTGREAVIAGTPHIPRAWHSATLLGDGTVLVAGGVDSTGALVALPERFVPSTQGFEMLSPAGLTPRAQHSATLLTDGRVLLAGGISGDARNDADLWDPELEAAAPVESWMLGPRRNHDATLLPDGRVRLTGGVDQSGQPVQPAEAFDPITLTFMDDSVEPGPDVLYLAAFLPGDGASDVPVEAQLVLRFSRPVDVRTFGVDTVVLSGTTGRVPLLIVPAERGRLAFLTPVHALEPSAAYTLAVAGLRDDRGEPVVPAAVRFTTAARPSDPPEPDFESWDPEAPASRGWRSGRPDSPWRTLPPLQGPAGVTALAGQVLRLDGSPLADVTLMMEGRSARSDETGRFLLMLDALPPGWRKLVMDGRTASQPGRTYGVFDVGLEMAGGQTNVLPFTIWMPRLDTVHSVRIPSPTPNEVVITTPRIRGLEVRLPPNTVIRDRDGEVVHELSITPIPIDRPPFPLPANVEVPIYFTVQPGGAYIHTYNPSGPRGARIVYPNYYGDLPEANAGFWQYDPEGSGWYVYGIGKVSADGRQVVPDPEVAVYDFTGAMINLPGWTPPSPGPVPDGGPSRGDPVDLGTGLFVLDKTDLHLPDVLPVTLTRTYRPQDTASRPFGVGATHTYAMMLWSAQQYQVADLILPDGGRISYTRISAGTGWTDAVFETTTTPTAFYKSRITWNGRGWDLRLKDGTVYVFGENAPLQAIRDRHGNTITVTWSNGQSGTISNVRSSHGRWIDFSYDGNNRIIEVTDNFARTVSYEYDGSGRLWKVTDPASGVTEYSYDGSHRMTSIKDARGIVFLTNEYDGNGRTVLQTLADDSTYEFEYTLDNDTVTQADVTDPRGVVERFTFNGDGYWLSRTEAVGTSVERTTTVDRESGTQLITSLTDALG